MQRQLTTLVDAMNRAVGKLVAVSGVNPELLTRIERQHANMIDYAVKLQHRLDSLGHVEGEVLGLQRDTTTFQRDVELLISAIDSELKGQRIGPAVAGLGALGQAEPGTGPNWWMIGTVVAVAGAALWTLSRMGPTPAR
jgi:hypothetical protein